MMYFVHVHTPCYLLLVLSLLLPQNSFLPTSFPPVPVLYGYVSARGEPGDLTRAVCTWETFPGPLSFTF